jgi:hypothetical protein
VPLGGSARPCHCARFAIGIPAPLAVAVPLFALGWVVAQVLGQAVLPLWRPSYAEDGGELGRSGVTAATAFTALFLAAGAVAFATQPPTVTLAAGVHQGPIVITHSAGADGKPGAVVRGGIVVRASDVTIKNLTSSAARTDRHRARPPVKIENVRLAGAQLDGIHVRFGQVMVRNCAIVSSGPFAQAVDISYSMDWGMSAVEDCDVSGGLEGIVTHSSVIVVMGNHVHGTRLRGITMGEMSMGEVSKNTVTGARGRGVLRRPPSARSRERRRRNALRRHERPRAGGDGIEAVLRRRVARGERPVGNPHATAVFSNSLREPPMN